MGCTTSRESSSQSEEERLITTHEDDLLFYKHPAIIIEAQIKRETANGVLTLPKLQRLLTSLKIALPLDNPEAPVVQFFESLKTAGVISTNKMVLLGILLGTGTLQKRALLLFEHADVQAKGKLNRSEVASLFQEILSVVIESLPVLAYSEKHDTLIKNYQRRLSGNSKMQVSLALSTLMQSDASISQARFVSVLSKHELRHWLITYELRGVLINSHDEVLSSMKRINDSPVDNKPFFFKNPPIQSTESPVKPSFNEAFQGSQGANRTPSEGKTRGLSPSKEEDAPQSNN